MIKYNVSPYTIYVDLQKDEKIMLVHGYTGAVDIVNQELANFMKSAKEITSKDLEKSLLHKLIGRGYITSKTFKQEQEFVIKLANVLHRCDKELYKNFIFVITYNCNFRCPYCFENTISCNGKKWSKDIFTKEMVDKAYDVMSQIEQNDKLINKYITLYGGEPLMKENKDIVQYIVNKGQEKGFSFGVITNGYDLEYFKDLLSERQIRSLQITIDGKRENHDSKRFHYTEGGSFDKIIDNIGVAIKKGVKVSVRINTDKDNYHDLEYLKTLFKEYGFLDSHLFNFYSAYIYATDYENNNLYTRKEYIDKHNQDNNQFNCQDWGIYQKVLNSFENKKPIQFRSVFCSSQSSAYVLDPYGDIYTCLEAIGTKDNIIGNYTSNIVKWSENINVWHKTNIESNDKCVKCKYVFICSGGCPSNVIVKNENKYCSDYKYVFAASSKRAYNNFLNKKSH